MEINELGSGQPFSSSALAMNHHLPSTDTFDLPYCLAINTHYSPLLDLAFSPPSLPSLSSSDSIPPFPETSLAHKVHVDTYLSLHQPNHLGRFSTSAGADPNSGIGVLLAAPTAPRLRNMIRESLHIKKWLNGLMPTSAVSIRKTSRHDNDEDWKAEGSLYTSDEFAEALEKSRSLRAPVDSKRTDRAILNRNALVIEKGQGDQPSPETIGDVLNLKRRSIFFKADSHQTSTSPAVDRSPPTPCLMVSTSDAVFQISLESSSDLSATVPTTLAARRGKKMLPHLSLKQNHDEESYPSIPTAFLGTSSDRWPPERTAYHENPRMDLQSMLSTLQSHRVTEPFLSRGTTTSCLQKKENSDNDSDSDEWAFADAFISEYGDLSLGSSGHGTASLNVTATGITGSDTSNVAENESSKSHCTFSEIPPFAELGGSSIVSLSQQPTLKTPPQEVRGILKGCKNVRFASLPNRQWSEEQQSWPDISMTQTIPTPAQGTQRTGVKGSRRVSTVTSGTFLRRSRPPNPFKLVHNQSHPTVPKANLNNRPASSSCCKARSSSALEVSADVPQRHSVVAVTPKVSVAPASRLRNVTNAKSTSNKENEKRLTMPNRRPLDENAGRRDSSLCQPKETLAKKRMPLRNILTRFK